MHKFAKEIMESVKNEVCGIGKDNLTTDQLETFKCWTEIAKNIVCFDKDYSIVEAMEKAENEEEKMEMIEKYTDYPERKMYDHYRYSNGRFAPKGKGSYRGYTEILNPDMEDAMRDMDRHDNRMYYPGGSNSGSNGSSNTRNYEGSRDMREGKNGMSRRHYMETKEMHKSGTVEDKQMNMQKLDAWLGDIWADLKEAAKDMTPEEKEMIKSRFPKWSSQL